MTERRLTILQINDLHGYLEPHPEVFRGRGKFNYRTCGGLARIAHGISDDLIGRAADVMLKERRPLVLVFRETPLSTVHLENMMAATRAGALILPASPSFYSKPEGVNALVDTVNARVLDHLGIDNKLMPRWGASDDRSLGESPHD